MWILQNPSYNGYVASFKIRSLRDLSNSHVLEDLAQVEFYGRQNSARTRSTTYVYTRQPTCDPNPNASETDQLQHDCPATCVILPSPSSHYALFPAKLKFCVFFKYVTSNSLFFEGGPNCICRKMSIFITNLIHKFFISIHLLHSSTCFEHYCAHLQEDNCISSASGIATIFGWLFSTQVKRGLS